MRVLLLVYKTKNIEQYLLLGLYLALSLEIQPQELGKLRVLSITTYYPYFIPLLFWF
jgi:hypothetical protein